MSTLLKSQLNPLANAFFPTNHLNVLRNKRVIELIETESENESNKTLQRIEKQDSNDRDSEGNISKEITAKLYKDIVSKDTFFFSRITSISMGLKNSNITDQKSYMRSCHRPKVECSMDYNGLVNKSYEEQILHFLQNYRRLMVKCSKDDDQRQVQKPSVAVTITPKIATKDFLNREENECTCPPMFGWIVPPDFIGNPFNFKYECSKKYPHSRNSNTDINRWTLDKCYSEMQDIVTDVIDTISVDSDLEVSDTEMDTESSEEESNETESFDLVSKSKIPEPELMDDGFHPLLQSPPINEEDDKDLVEKVEKILEKSLSPLPDCRDSMTFYSESDDPCSQDPCSQWCDCLPYAVKETYKHIKKSVNEKYCNGLCHRQRSFKRSFSADDVPMYGRLGEASPVESGDIMLRRKNSVNFFKNHSNFLINGRKRVSCDLTDQQLYTNSNVKSNKWGKFGGEDSLWKPLPDCFPFDVRNLKPNIHKRDRDARRINTN